MIKKIKNWIKTVFEGVLNNIIYFFEKNFTNLFFFYLLIFTATWIICNYKLQKLHLYNIKAQDILSYNEKYLTINNFIMNKCILVVHNIHNPDNESILELKNSIINKKINVNMLYDIVIEKKKIKKVAIWEEDFDLWKEFKKNPRHNISNFSKNTELFEENKIEFSILKKNKIKLLFGFSLLIISDLLLKNITI